MSRAGRFLFLFSFLFFLLLCVTRIIYGGWHNGMWGPLGLSILFSALGIAKDFRGIKEVLSMRTTKHGMNMGVLIVLVVVGLTCLNILAVRYEKRFDWTSERLNSLSDQSRKAAETLKVETKILVLYRKGAAGDENIARSVADLVAMYQNVNSQIKYESFNALQRPDLAREYEFNQGPYSVWAIQGSRKTKIETPNEEGVTRALLKMGRDRKKTIYFTMGHGERVLEDRTEAGLSRLKEELDVTYDVKPLILFQEKNKVPEDAQTVAVVRPMQQFLESEIQALRDYAKRGGHLFLALDPGMKQNLALLTKSFGVEFANNFILDLRSQIVQGGPAMVLGTEFSKTSDITKAFTLPRSFVIFNMASELKIAVGHDEKLKIEPLVSTTAQTMSIPEPTEKVAFQPNGPHILGVSVEGEGFSSVVLGDSDFMANNYLSANLDRDLAVNSFAWLAADRDLISIRPKEARVTKLNMLSQDYYILILGFLLPLPICLLLGGGFVWWRRKSA